MKEVGNSRILRIILLLIVVCFVSLPAYAKYSGGTGEPNDPYQLATAEDLILLGESPVDYDKHFILTADIDLDPNLPGRKVFDKAVIAPDADPEKDYFQGTAFTGVFDGNGHTISHLTIMGTGYLGLFGQLGTGAEVKNVGLVDVNITGSGDYVGGLVGSNGGWYSGGGVLINCYSTGTVTGNDDVGGLVGDNYAGSITSSYSTGVVSSTGRSVGGLVGFNWDASITTSYSTGMVTGNEDASITTSYSTGMVTGNEDVGGLVGFNWFGSITTSYSTGTVNGYSYVGGLVGNNGGSIITSCSTGTVTGNLSVGGLVGWNTSSITSSYSIGMVTGDDYVGGLVGWNYGAISTSYSTGSVSGTGLSVGGLVGFNRRHSRRGSITSSYSTGMVTGNEDVGGLVGSNSGGIINSSYSTGMVSGETGVGGLVGLNWFGSISTSYSTGSVSGNSDVGGLVGYSDYGIIIITSFWDIESSGQATSASGTGLTTAEMQDPNTFMDAGWDFVGKPDGPHDIWAESEGGGYPILCWQLPQGFGLPTFSGGTGEADDPYRISTPSELNGISHNPRLMDAHFELVNDIDLAGIDFYIIGSEFYPFTGSFNGNGHTISHMTIVGNDSLGLFGYLESGAEVKNLGVVDVNVTGSYFCGGLVGFNWDASITTSYSTGMVIGETGVGGLVGVNSGSITTSYSAGTVSGETGVGGLVGDNDGSITSSYSTGMVTGDDYVGGLVGFNFIGSSITTCYSTGEVSATSWEVGGLVGDSMSREEVHNSFWDIETSGQLGSSGGTGKTTAEMQTESTFTDAGWDFVDETANGTEDIWWILEGQDYPRLWWEAGNN